MPGIDGWETLRRIRAMDGPQPQVAIVSANAFDRGLDNGLGLPPDDFIVKPVRHSELLDWLERKLELVWVESTESVSAMTATLAVSRVSIVNPPRDEVMALQALVRLGFYRGIVNKLDALAISFPACTDFVDQQRALARQYQFETMQAQLQSVLNESPVH